MDRRRWFALATAVVMSGCHLYVAWYGAPDALTFRSVHVAFALVVYAACGISRAALWESSAVALRLGATGFVIPFMFVFGPALLMVGAPGDIILAAVTATAGVTCLSAGLFGYLFRPTTTWERVLLIAGSVVLIKPGLYTDLVGAALAGVVVARQLAVVRRPGVAGVTGGG